MVGCTGRPIWTYGNGDLSICVHYVYCVTTCRTGRKHIVAAAHLQIVINLHLTVPFGSFLSVHAAGWQGRHVYLFIYLFKLLLVAVDYVIEINTYSLKNKVVLVSYVKVKRSSICIAPLNETSLRRLDIVYQGISQFYRHTLRFIRKRNEPYLPLPSQPQLVLSTHLPTQEGWNVE